MIDVRETPDFTNWLAALNDQRARLQIVRRIERVAAGNFGDSKPVGGTVSEFRIEHGPGYRVITLGAARSSLSCSAAATSGPRVRTFGRPKAKEIAETLKD